MFRAFQLVRRFSTTRVSDLYDLSVRKMAMIVFIGCQSVTPSPPGPSRRTPRVGRDRREVSAVGEKRPLPVQWGVFVSSWSQNKRPLIFQIIDIQNLMNLGALHIYVLRNIYEHFAFQRDILMLINCYFYV